MINDAGKHRVNAALKAGKPKGEFTARLSLGRRTRR